MLFKMYSIIITWVFFQTACVQKKAQPVIFDSGNTFRIATQTAASKSSTNACTAGGLGNNFFTSWNTTNIANVVQIIICYSIIIRNIIIIAIFIQTWNNESIRNLVGHI